MLISTKRCHFLKYVRNMFLSSLLSLTLSCDLYYKTITIIIMTIVSDATIRSVTYDRN